MSFLIENPSFIIPIPESEGVDGYTKRLEPYDIRPEFQELKDSKLELFQGDNPVVLAEGFLKHKHFTLRCMNANLTRGYVIDVLTQNGITEIILPSTDEVTIEDHLRGYGKSDSIDWRIACLAHQLHNFGTAIPPDIARGQLRYKIQRNWSAGVMANFSHILSNGWLPANFVNDDMKDFKRAPSTQNEILFTNLLLERVIAALIAVRGEE